MQILARVQHHPSRAHILPRLLQGLVGLDVQVIAHQSVPANAWHGYRACLEAIPDGVTHLLVIQDDAQPCRNLAAALPLLPADVPVCLFVGNQPTRTRRAYWRSPHARYLEIHRADWVPVVAVLWPTDLARQFLAWTDQQPVRRSPDSSDDAVAGRWMRATRQRVLATNPSLVEHPDDTPSTVKPRRHRIHALNYIGDGDPLELDWS